MTFLSGPTTRLVGGRKSREGRVEVFHDGVWGTVCDDGWDSDDVKVVCRELGLTITEAHVPILGHVEPGEGQIWLENVGCSGDENQLADCDHRGWGNVYCLHWEDARASCGGKNVLNPHEYWSNVLTSG